MYIILELVIALACNPDLPKVINFQVSSPTADGKTTTDGKTLVIAVFVPNCP